MNATEISVIARNLFEAQGAKSIIEAAQKAAAFEKAGVIADGIGKEEVTVGGGNVELSDVPDEGAGDACAGEFGET